MKSLSLTVSLVVAFIFLTPFLAHAQEATLFISGARPVSEGDRVTLSVLISAPQTAVNAVSGTIVFPESLLRVVSVTKNKSIFNLWTKEPQVQRNKIVFEGVIVNPGFQGNNGALLQITFEAKRNGVALIDFTEGAVLANDGLGTNLLTGLKSTSFAIKRDTTPQQDPTVVAPPVIAVAPQTPLVALPVITEYSSLVAPKEPLFVKGKGAPNAITKIRFRDTSVKSLGEQFIIALQKNRIALDEVLVKNNEDGLFEYVSPANLIAGTYNATPYLVDADEQTEKPGFGVQFFINESPIVKRLVVLINILILLIPIVGLGVLIYFIPWYSRLRMRLIQKKVHLEEEKIDLSEAFLKQKERFVDKQ